MNALQTALLASSLLLVTYSAAPAPAHAGGKPGANFTPDVSRAERQTNLAADVAIEVARQGLPVRPEVEALQDSVGVEELTYIGLPDQCVIQFMLTQELNQLHALAILYMAHEAELQQALFQIVVGRYERAVTKIDQAWANGEIADDIALAALVNMRVDAFTYIESLGVSSIRARLEEAMARLIARGTDAMERAEAVTDIYKTIYELRVEAALAVLQARIADGEFTKLDYERVEQALRGLEILKHSLVPYDCAS